MKTLSFILASALFSTAPGRAEAPVLITLGAAHCRVLPSEKDEPAHVYIEVFTKVTNTSKVPVSFWTQFGNMPDFSPYVREKAGSRHWTDLTVRGMCALSYNWITLAPGESLESETWVSPEYAGKPFRVALQVSQSGTYRPKGVRVRSNAILLPSQESPKKADPRRLTVVPDHFVFQGKTKGHGFLSKKP